MNDDAFAKEASERPHSDDRAEIAELRQRLAFYEGFDRIIQENVTRAGDLLRLAAERQAEADRAAALARQELDAETQRHRAVLEQLLTDVGRLRVSLDAVERRLASSLEPNRTGGETAVNDPPPVGGTLWPSAIDLESAEAADAYEQATADRRLAAEEGRERSTDEPTQPPDAARWSAGTTARMAERVDDRAARAHRTLVVHGLGDVASARSLVEHLRGLEGIASVEPREFADGVLRLEVDGLRAIRADDVTSWDQGQVEVADEGRDALVVRLPNAPTL